MAQERLKRSELEILQKEEEALKEIIAKYEDALNKLKVEELTIRSELGRAQDKDLQSRNTTPVSIGTTSRPDSTNNGTLIASSPLPLRMFRSLADREDDMEIISAQPTTVTDTISESVRRSFTTATSRTRRTSGATINQSTLNLGTALIHPLQEEEEETDDEQDIFPTYRDLQFKMFQDKMNAENIMPSNQRLNLDIKMEQLEEEGLLENNGKKVENKIKEEPMEQVNDDESNDSIHVVRDKCSNKNISDKVTLNSDEE